MTERVAKAIPGSMTKFKLRELSGVTRPAQTGAKAVFLKVAEGEEGGVAGTMDPFIKREFTDEQRQKLADEGKAMPGGGFPIENTGDLENAIRAFGRAKDKDATKRHIIARAKALGASDKLPESWSVSKAGDGSTQDGGPMSNAIKKALGLADTATDEEVTAAVIKLAGAEGREAAAKLAKAEAKTAYLTLLSKARPKDKEQMKADAADGDEPDADDEPDSPKAKKAIEYLSKSIPERDAIIAKRESGDETLVVSGVTIRKSETGAGVFAVLKAQEERIAKGEEAVAKANEVNEVMGFTKAATDDYGHLAGSIPEKVGILRHMAKADEPTRKAFDTLMKAAEATSKLAFTRLGHGQGGVEKTDDPEAKLDALAKERMEKSAGKLTFEKAYDEVIKENPELYAQSVASKPVAQA